MLISGFLFMALLLPEKLFSYKNWEEDTVQAKMSTRMFLVAAFRILFSVTSVLLISCGGGGDSEKPDWIVPEDISGVYTALFDKDPVINRPKLKEYRFTIEENDGVVVGQFEEFYYSGEYFIHPANGDYDSTNGFLYLSHDSNMWGYFTEIFKFSSETKMHAVYEEHRSYSRYECNKLVWLSP